MTRLPTPAAPHRPTRQRLLQGLALAMITSALLTLAPTAQAAKKSKKSPDASHQVAKKHNAKKVKPSQNHSGETTAERERRLTRECRGMPNAGACLGYARP